MNNNKYYIMRMRRIRMRRRILKKRIDNACIIIGFISFITLIGTVGAFDNGAITAGQCNSRLVVAMLMALVSSGIMKVTNRRVY